MNELRTEKENGGKEGKTRPRNEGRVTDGAKKMRMKGQESGEKGKKERRKAELNTSTKR